MGWTTYAKEEVLPGELSIFKIRYDDGTEPGRWYCEFRTNGKRVRKSTKKTGLGEAVDAAKTIFFEARGIEKAGLNAHEKTLSQVAKEYLRNLEDGVASNYESNSKAVRHKGVINGYLLERLGALKIGEITGQNAEDYKHWRRHNKKSVLNVWGKERRLAKLRKGYEETNDIEIFNRLKGLEKRLQKSLDKPPSPATLNTEMTVLRAVLKFALRRGYISLLPDIANVSLRNLKNARPAFTLDEIKILFEAANARRNTNEPIDSLSREYRTLLYNFIRVAFLTGLRTTEQLVLRYEDFEIGVSSTRIRVRAEQEGAGKTGARTVIASEEVGAIISKMKGRSSFNEPSDYVWCHPKQSSHAGKRIVSFKKNFKSLLDAAELEKDSDGNNRTLYSLRHSHITTMLNRQGLTLYQLAENVGNSPEVIRRFYGKGIAFDRVDSSALLTLG